MKKQYKSSRIITLQKKNSCECLRLKGYVASSVIFKFGAKKKKKKSIQWLMTLKGGPSDFEPKILQKY